MKKFIPSLICAAIIALTVSSCEPVEEAASSTPEPVSSAAVSSVPKLTKNPLTGLENLAPGKETKRFSAVMINNIKTAWEVQTGLGAADIVLETLAEGGVTRLMAVFQDVSKAPQLGPIRSARLSYGELARGFDAVYFSFGLDKTYFGSQISNLDITHADLMKAEAYTFREKNGKAYEHTLYSNGEKLSKYTDSKISRKNTNITGALWDFAPEGEPVALTGGDAASVTYKMSTNNTYTNSFTYDAVAGVYLKSQGGAPHKDWKTGEQLRIINVFLLFSKITELSDREHVKTDLSSGSGYYFSFGKYQQITWEKGGSKDQIKFKNADGSALKINPGNSWISIPDSAQSSTLVIN